MNCLDCRSLCLVEPNCREPRVYMHLYHCPACRAYRRKVQLAEKEMTAVMSVPVPEGLSSKIVFDTEMQTRMSFPGLGWRAMAASLVLVVALGIAVMAYRSGPDVVPTLAMHIADDPLHMSPPQSDAAQRMEQVMRHLGAQWEGSELAITHATLCLVKERAAAHLVVAGKQGPVTVFLIPKFRARDRNDVIVDGQVAEVQALASGSMALFGYPGEDFDAIAAQFGTAIRWAAKQPSLNGQLRLAGK